MAGYESGRSKAETVARMYFLGNTVAAPLGPGSKEKRSALVALGTFVGLDLQQVATKRECGRLIAERVGAEWDEACFSTGDTITLLGLNRLVDGAVAWHTSRGEPPFRSLVRDLMTVSPVVVSDGNDEVLGVSQDLSELEQNIKDHVDELSRETITPPGVEVSHIPEDATIQLSLEDGSWRSMLVRVQGWLHLPSMLEVGAGGERFDRSLGSMLGLDESAVQDRHQLFSRLQERLERAVQLRDQFLAELEADDGGDALAAAARNWASSWGDVEESDDAESSGPISATADIWPINQFRQYAVDGDMELSPSYQRADVWPTTDAQVLIESVLRGIPLPSIILLRRNTQDGDRYEIVDGKQRLTSILRFLGAHPKAINTVRAKAAAWGLDPDDLVSIFQQNYPEFKKLWRRNELTSLTARVEKEHHFPFPLRSGEVPALAGELTQLRGHYYSEIRSIVIPVGQSRKRVRALFEDVSDYKIPVIVYENATSRQIHEVFSLYNKQGKHLNAEEIRNAAFHELDLMKAVLATAGDTDNVSEVAPFLAPVWDTIDPAWRVLARSPYGLADAGYKRTKVLSWVLAALALNDEGLSGRSTATHITNLFKRVQAGAEDPLRDRTRVTAAMEHLALTVDAHQSLSGETWHTRFRNAQRDGGRWQELQLVASLIGLASAGVVLGDDLVDIVDEKTDEMSEASAHWVRPTKTQSREQWEFVGGVVRGILEVLEVDPSEAHTRTAELLGTSGVRVLTSQGRPAWWP